MKSMRPPVNIITRSKLCPAISAEQQLYCTNLQESRLRDEKPEWIDTPDAVYARRPGRQKGCLVSPG